jgi:hypothetical protein
MNMRENGMGLGSSTIPLKNIHHGRQNLLTLVISGQTWTGTTNIVFVYMKMLITAVIRMTAHVIHGLM